jgi:hypothetical protein
MPEPQRQVIRWSGAVQGIQDYPAVRPTAVLWSLSCGDGIRSALAGHGPDPHNPDSASSSGNAHPDDATTPYKTPVADRCASQCPAGPTAPFVAGRHMLLRALSTSVGLWSRHFWPTVVTPGTQPANAADQRVSTMIRRVGLTMGQTRSPAPPWTTSETGCDRDASRPSHHRIATTRASRKRLGPPVQHGQERQLAAIACDHVEPDGSARAFLADCWRRTAGGTPVAPRFPPKALDDSETAAARSDAAGLGRAQVGIDLPRRLSWVPIRSWHR